MMMRNTGFEYLKETARKYGNLYLVHEIDAFIKGITKPQLDELGAAYWEMARREDSEAISRWMDACFENRDNACYEEFRFSRSVGRLLCLFANLAERGISPFDSREVGYLEKRLAPDWEKLPEPLHYLIHPAEKYGIYLADAAMINFLQHKATAEDLNELATTAERIRVNGDYERIIQWLKQYSMVDHREAYLVSNLMGVMDYADLDFT